MPVLDFCHPTNADADLLELVANPVADCHQHWQRVVEHPVYQRELGRICAHLVRNYGLPYEWEDDIQHEALLLLHRSITRNLDLGFDPAKMNGGPLAWLRAVIRSHCLQAIRTLRRRRRRMRTFGDAGSKLEATPERHWRGVFWLALEALPIDARQVIDAYLDGGSVQAVADRLGLPWSTARRAIKKHLRTFRRELETKHLQDSPWEYHILMSPAE